MLIRLLSIVILGLGLALDLYGQEISFEQYLELIQRYREGDFTWTVEELAPATKRFIDRAGRELPRRTASETDRKAAVLLHTQTAVLKENQGEAQLRRAHFDVARGICGRLSDRNFEQNWLLALGYYHQALLEAETAVSIFEVIRRDFPSNSETLLALGTVYEVKGSFAGGPKSGPSSHRQPTIAVRKEREGIRLRGESRKNLEKAEEYYRRAIDETAEHVEAHLRLGRVSHLLGKDEEALHLLSWVTSHASDGYLRSMAHLFSGRMYEERGDADMAIEHYRGAVAAHPRMQVFHLALSHALHRVGNRRESIDVMTRALELSANPRSPSSGRWRYYLKMHTFMSEVMKLRRGVLQ